MKKKFTFSVSFLWQSREISLYMFPSNTENRPTFSSLSSILGTSVIQ